MRLLAVLVCAALHRTAALVCPYRYAKTCISDTCNHYTGPFYCYKCLDYQAAVDSWVNGVPTDYDAQMCRNCGPGNVQTQNQCQNRCISNNEVMFSFQRFATGGAYCQTCPAGSFADFEPFTPQDRDIKTICRQCPAGTFSSDGATFCRACPAGTAAAAGATSCATCSIGYAAGPRAASCDYCDPGSTAAIGGVPTKSLGAHECARCDAGTYASSDYVHEFTTLGQRYYRIMTCSPCAAGTFNDNNGAESCSYCPAGTFSTGLATACTSCGDRADSHWDAVATRTTSLANCRCAPAFTGQYCNLDACDDMLRGASLGGLLLEAAWPESTRDMVNAELAWNTIFRSADTNGDNYLSRAEALVAIASMHMVIPDAAMEMPVWSRQLAGSFEFETFDEWSVTISEMVEHTIAARTSVDLHQYVGGTSLGLISVEATYPAADWDDNKCETNENAGVNFAWSLISHLDSSQKRLYRQCSFRNGVLHDAFSRKMASASGCNVVLVDGVTTTQCALRDGDVIGDGDNRKRLYCVEALFCASPDRVGGTCNANLVDPSLTEVRCSTGLVYDGAPADVVPALISATGVRFSWLDTSRDEEGFRIFRSPVGAPEKTTLIADIPTTSKHCGQPFSPISYYDRDVGDVPGTHVMYTVSTIQGGEPKDSTTALFTSPWVGTLTVSVITESGSPVRGVSVSVDHLLDDGSVDEKYAPLIAGETDIFGDFESEIRVTDRTWAAVKQHFLVRVSKTTELRDGTFQHVFAPPEEHVTVSHFKSATLDFVDESAVAISGVVRYDFLPGDFGKVGACEYEDSAVGCYCPVLGTVVVVDRGRGDVETYATDGAGAFSFAAAYMSNVTVHLQKYGAAGVGRDHAFRLDAVAGDGDEDSSRAAPSTTFVATQDTVLEFVATDSVDVRVGVLGGGDGVAYVHGQPVVFALDGCGGFRRELYTYQGYVATALPPAPKFQLRLGAADASCAVKLVGDIVQAATNTAIAGCRVEMPRFSAPENVTRPCAASTFRFVDEYFAAVGSDRSVDLSALALNASDSRDEVYSFPAPLCLDTVLVEAQQLRDLNRWASQAAFTRTLDANEAMLLRPPLPEAEGPEPYGSACFGKKTLGGVFVEGDSFKLKFGVVERHPAVGLLWPWSYKLEGGVATEVLDGYVNSKPLAGAAISIVINDGISGGESEPGTYALDADFGFTHSVAVGDPNPFTPFTKVIFFEFERALDGGRIDFTRHAVVLGVIQDDVPQIFMMSTDPTLIFTVLRDPPGGDSFATLTEGTEVSMSMSIAGMHAAGHEYEATNAGTLGVSVRLGMSAGFGVEAAKNLVDLRAGAGLSHSLTGPAVGASRSQSQAHDLTFTFDVAISTSTDPFLAGQPSDVIVGGGANIRVLTAIKVDIANEAGDMYCVSGERTHEWLPEQVSTFVTTVYEIEKTMLRLGGLIRDETDGEGNESEYVPKYRTGLENWKTVLKNYRDVTRESITTVDAGINAALSGFKAQFQKFTEATAAEDSAFSSYLQDGLGLLSESSDVTRFSAVPGQNHIHRDDVQSYAKSVTKFLQASEANCKVGDQFGIGTLCKVDDQLAKSVDAAHKLLGVCDFDSTEAQSAAVSKFCQEREHGEPGGPAGAGEAARSAFDALSDTDRLVTFSGTAAVELEWAIGETTARTSDVGYTSDASTSYGVSQSVCADILRKRRLGGDSGRRLGGDYSGQGSWSGDYSGQGGGEAESKFGAMADAPGFCRRLAEARRSESPLSEADRQATRRLGIGINADFSQTWGSSLSVELSRSSARSQTHGQAVAVTLGDPSPYDFFAVKITQDPVHGTPIFTTMGGQSSCPGETATTKIDSRVTITALEYHCGDSFKPRADCEDLEVGDVATIGVILQNISPSLRGVLYRLDVQQVSPWNAGKYFGGEAGYCGAAGDSSGLDIKINGHKSSAFMLDGLPYGQSEVLLTVTRTHPSCYEFNDVEIKLTSQCEYDADDVYQYRTTLNADTGEVTVVHPVYDDANAAWGLDAGEETAALGAANSAASFSVAWRRARPMTTPEPSTRFPTRAPTEAALSISIAVVAAVSANATQSSYCADLVSSGMVDVQAKIVEGYVVDRFGFAPAASTTAACVDGAGADSVAVVVHLSLYASDVVDRANGKTAKSFAEDLSFIVKRKIITGAWLQDQRDAIAADAAEVPGRRLMDAAWAAALLEASKFSNETQVESVETLQPSLSPTVSKSPVIQPTPGPSISPLPTRAPRTYAAAPSDDDDDAAAATRAIAALSFLVSVLVALNVVVVFAVFATAAVLLWPHCGGEARIFAAGLKSFRRRKKEHRDDPKIHFGGGDTEMADRALPPSPLHH